RNSAEARRLHLDGVARGAQPVHHILSTGVGGRSGRNTGRLTRHRDFGIVHHGVGWVRDRAAHLRRVTALSQRSLMNEENHDEEETPATKTGSSSTNGHFGPPRIMDNKPDTHQNVSKRKCS